MSAAMAVVQGNAAVIKLLKKLQAERNQKPLKLKVKRAPHQSNCDCIPKPGEGGRSS
jgi:hypothetical protein